MNNVNSPSPHSSYGPFGLNPAIVGTVCCIISALCYTAANTCLRKLAALDADEVWVTCMKEVVTVSVIGPWLLIQTFRGRPVVPPGRTLLALILTGLAVQLAGNVPVQWAFGVVGMAITIPTIFGVMLTAVAVFGFVFLGERVSTRSIAAIGLLIFSIVLLSLGASAAGQSNGGSSGPVLVVLAIGAGGLAGIMFATLSTVIRFTATARVPVASIVFVITGMGVLSLGSLSVWRFGARTLLDTDPEQLTWMLYAGSFNLVAFLAITKGLQLTTVVHANVLNATQVALGAVVGMTLFSEPRNFWGIVGICLTIVGVVLYGHKAAVKKTSTLGPTK